MVQVTLTATGGTISCDLDYEGNGYFFADVGTTTIINLIPDAGSILTGLLVDGSENHGYLQTIRPLSIQYTVPNTNSNDFAKIEAAFTSASQTTVTIPNITKNGNGRAYFCYDNQQVIQPGTVVASNTQVYLVLRPKVGNMFAYLKYGFGISNTLYIVNNGMIINTFPSYTFENGAVTVGPLFLTNFSYYLIAEFSELAIPPAYATVTIGSPENGSFKVSTEEGFLESGENSVFVGTELFVEATPDDGYRISEPVSSQEFGPIGFPLYVSGDMFICPIFVPRTVTLTYTITGSGNGTLTGRDDLGNAVTAGSNISYNSHLHITATAGATSSLTGLSISFTDPNTNTLRTEDITNNEVFDLKWDITFTATFTAASVSTTPPANVPATAWNTMAAAANSLLSGATLGSDIDAATAAAVVYASTSAPAILSRLPAGTSVTVTGDIGNALVASMAGTKSLNGLRPPLPINIVAPTVASGVYTLPAPSSSLIGGTYFAGIDKAITRTYKYANSEDTLILNGVTGSQTFHSVSANSNTVLSLGASYTITFNNGAPPLTLTVNYLGCNGSTVAPVSQGLTCFLAAAPVLTPAGYRPIASLRVGDRVTTAGGTSSAIRRISKQSVGASAETNPYKIPKGQFGAIEDLLISPNHCVLTTNGLVEARRLGLKQKAQKADITYYNLELETWANMIVAGVTVESLAPVQRVTVTMAEFEAMIKNSYGPMTVGLQQKIDRVCRFLADGRVELPAISTKNVTSRG